MGLRKGDPLERGQPSTLPVRSHAIRTRYAVSMRRGQTAKRPASEGFTKQQLMEAANISANTFDRLRRAARIKGPSHGGLAWVIPFGDIQFLIRTAENGKHTEMGPPCALAWRQLLREHGQELG